MFFKSTMKKSGIDITIKNNPGHVLSPDRWDMVMGVKFGKVSKEEYQEWYRGLLKERWGTRKQEILDLVKQGTSKDINLKCYCPIGTSYCHAEIAAKFLNALISKLTSP